MGAVILLSLIIYFSITKKKVNAIKYITVIDCAYTQTTLHLFRSKEDLKTNNLPPVDVVRRFNGIPFIIKSRENLYAYSNSLSEGVAFIKDLIAETYVVLPTENLEKVDIHILIDIGWTNIDVDWTIAISQKL